MATPWRLERRSGTSQELHDLDLDAGGEPDAAVSRLVRWNQVTDASLVVGSAQPPASIDPAGLEAAGLRSARRRSGGGAVLLLPGAQVWVDVFLPSDDELWCDDVDRSAWWLGAVWVDALGSLLPHWGDRLSVHHAASTDPAAGRIACFASVGPGEVLVDGRKLVGVSQRRTRRWARFQCVVHLRWDATPVLSSLSDPGRTPDLVHALGDVAALEELAAGEPGGAAGESAIDEWSVVEALHSHLPA